MNNKYDYIITGSGCAGLSLLYRMLQESCFDEKQILIIDRDNKTSNDRTWCYWENRPGPFEAIVCHKWKYLDFHSHRFSRMLDIRPYEYKMIRAVDFYQYVLEKAKNSSNVHFRQAPVDSLINENNKAVVFASGQKFYADYVFNSIPFEKPSGANIYSLVQHFKGWQIETPDDCFNEQVATFMDFRIDQRRGASFVYVLPQSAKKALVEYTLITAEVLRPCQYDEELNKYIHGFLHLDRYTITGEEYGVIPMTNYIFSKGEGKIVNMGTAGGQTKASSGFTFSFIQKHCSEIIAALAQNRDPRGGQSMIQRRFRLYDSVLLNILQNKKMGADKIFADLFSKNPPQRVLRFMDNETTLTEDLLIMNSVSKKVFLPATIRELLYR